MTDKFIDPKTNKEMFRINDANQETFTKDFKKKEESNGTDNHRETGSGTADHGKES